MKDEVVGKRIFQKAGEVDQEEQQRVVATNLDIEKEAGLVLGEVAVLDRIEVNGKGQIDQMEKSRDQVEDPVGKIVVEAIVDDKQ